MKTKKTSKFLIEEKKKVEKEEIQLLLKGADEKIINKYSDDKIDRENQIIELINGNKISINKIKEFILTNPSVHVLTFGNEIYDEWRRLKGWNNNVNKNFKPHVFARYTVELIYGRFVKEVYPILKKQNPHDIYGSRQFKHFQFLTPEKKAILDEYIKDCIIVAKECKTWHEYKVKYGKKFGLPFQSSLFDEN